jgi:hypothetical protein
VRLVIGMLLCGMAVVGCSSDVDQPVVAPSVPAGTTSAVPRGTQNGVLFADDFETDPFPRWEPTTKAAWAWEKAGRSKAFELVKNVPLTESVRAPFNRNLIKKVVVGDFQLDVDLRSTTRAYPNQSLCLFFGYQDPAHMYYVHFGRRSSDTSNQVFIVNGKDRTPISTKTTSGTAWDGGWHHARIIRRAEGGTIEVYFDDMDKPVMTATDTTFADGRVGIGSFDDTGQFDNVVLRNMVTRARQR